MNLIFFHLAAQAIVSKSYDNPLDTFKTNIIGTANILGIIDKLPKKCIAVIITSDKCYENQGWHWPYRENDSLGGKDPYSASKACAELVYKAFENSFLKHQNDKKITATARAGNVVGGGDWSPHRVIPDAYKAMKSRTPLKLRNPYHTRPWQHVLEPLSGYLCLAAIMHHKPDLNGNNFNFGPSQNMNESVGDLVNSLRKHWPDLEISEEKGKLNLKKLLCFNFPVSFANKLLKWKSTLNFDETITLTAEWYSYYSQSTNSKNLFDFSENKFNYLQKLQNKEGSLGLYKTWSRDIHKIKEDPNRRWRSS